MRYFLVFIGLFGIALAIFLLAYGPSDSHKNAGAILTSASIFFGLGAAAIDIVEAIKHQE